VDAHGDFGMGPADREARVSAAKTPRSKPATRAKPAASAKTRPARVTTDAPDAPLAEQLSRPAEVDAFLRALDHPLASLLRQVRKVVLAAAPTVGEEIKWNGPTFFYTGPLPPSDPKAFARYLLNVNLFRPDALRLVLLRAGDLEDPTGLLEGASKDGRRLVTLGSAAELKACAGALQAIVRAQIAQMAT
jgi:hypothetical protein